MPEHICINPDERDKEELNNPARGVKLITVLPSSGCMSQYQKDYYLREVDVWEHAYRHHEDGHLLVIYQGECPTDWEWEQAQTTIWQLRWQVKDTESLNQDLYKELVWATA